MDLENFIALIVAIAVSGFVLFALLRPEDL